MIGNRRSGTRWLWSILWGFMLVVPAAGRTGGCALNLEHISAIATPTASMHLQDGVLEESGGQVELRWSGCPVSAATYQSALLDLTGLRAGAQAVLATTVADGTGQQRSYRWVIGEGPGFGLSRVADGVQERFVPVRMTAPEVISRNLTEAFAATGFIPIKVISTSLAVSPGSAVKIDSLGYGPEQPNIVQVRNNRLTINGKPVFVIRPFIVDQNFSMKQLVEIFDRMRNDLYANAVGVQWENAGGGGMGRSGYNSREVAKLTELAYSRGLFVVPQIGAPPSTDSYKPSEHLMISADGTASPRTVVSFSDPAVWRAQKVFLSRIIREFKNDPGTLAWYTGDEYAFPSYGGHFYSYDESSLRKFRLWLKKKYGELSQLNAAWDSHFATWGDVTPPRKYEYQVNFADWQHFRRETLKDYFHRLYTFIHQEDPNHPVWPTLYTYLTGGKHKDWSANWLSVSSWRDLVPEVDVVTRGIDVSTIGTRGSLLAQIASRDGKAVIHTMHLYQNPPYSKQITVPATMSLVFHGSLAGVSYWSFISRPIEDPMQRQAMFDAKTFTPIQPWYGQVAKVDKLLAALAPSLVGLRVPPAPVGIVVTDLSSLYGVNLAPVRGTTNLFRDLQIPVRFISGRNLGELPHCKVLVVGDEATVWSTQLTGAIRKFLAKGGRLLVNGNPARRDEENRVLAGDQLEALHRLLEACPRSAAKQETHPYQCMSDGGRILRFNVSISRTYTAFRAVERPLDPKLDGLRNLVGRFMKAAGVFPEAEFHTTASPRPTMEVMCLVGGGRKLIALINYSSKTVAGVLKVRCAPGTYQVEEKMPGEEPGGNDYSAAELDEGVPEKVAAFGVNILVVKRQQRL